MSSSSPAWESDCGTVRLWRGDCLEILPTWPAGAVDAVVTDPPYGLNIAYRSFDDSPENVRALAASWLPLARTVGRCVAFTPGMGSDRYYERPDHVAAWVMDAGGYRSAWGFGMWQPILCYGKDRYLATGQGARPDVIKTNGTDRVKPDHPCPKPTTTWQKIVQRFSVADDLVADPFMGSGTTGVAAVRLGRKFWGIELDEQYFEIAKRRIQDELKKVAFLEPAPKTLQASLLDD